VSAGEDTIGSGQARLLASGSLVQQLSQVTGLLALLAIVTVLARRLTLTEFGVYGLLTSVAGYLLVVQNSAAGAAVRNMAAAIGAEERDGAFSTAALLYAAAGLFTGVLIAVVGTGLALAVGLSESLEEQAIVGALLLGVVTAVGWPITVFRDALRARQLFVRAATIEMASLVVYAALVLGLTFAGASLGVLIGVSGTIPMLAGLGCAAAALGGRLPFHLRPRTVTRAQVVDFARLAVYLSLTEAAGTLIYALDRVILGVFRSAAVVGLYEGPVRAHNVLRSLNAAINVTVLPSASRYRAEGDTRRLSELLVRGSRYTLALVVPLTVTGMVLAPDILEVWLGPEFREAGLAMAILMSYWLVNGITGVVSPMLVACGRAPTLARYAWLVAVSNLAISLALTPLIGLEGVTIGTAVPYLIGFPLLLRTLLGEVPVAPRTLWSAAFAPAYVLGALLAAGLALARVAGLPDELIPLIAVVALGLVAYWVAYYLVWLRADERELVRELVLSAVPRRR
jgi:O-antigen/teichoic acid export membrane protein